MAEFYFADKYIPFAQLILRINAAYYNMISLLNSSALFGGNDFQNIYFIKYVLSNFNGSLAEKASSNSIDF